MASLKQHLHNHLRDRSEVIVHTDDVRSLLRNPGKNLMLAAMRVGPSFAPSPVTPAISLRSYRAPMRIFPFLLDDQARTRRGNSRTMEPNGR